MRIRSCMRSPCIQKIGSVTGCSVSRCRPHRTSFAFTDPFSRRWAWQRHTHLLFCSFPRDEQQQEDSRVHIGAIHNNGLFHLFCFTGKFTVFSGSSAQQLQHIQDLTVARCAHIATCKAAAGSSKTMTKYRSFSAEAPSAMIFLLSYLTYGPPSKEGSSNRPQAKQKKQAHRHTCA